MSVSKMPYNTHIQFRSYQEFGFLVNKYPISPNILLENGKRRCKMDVPVIVFLEITSNQHWYTHVSSFHLSSSVTSIITMNSHPLSFNSLCLDIFILLDHLTFLTPGFYKRTLSSLGLKKFTFLFLWYLNIHHTFIVH